MSKRWRRMTPLERKAEVARHARHGFAVGYGAPTWQEAFFDLGRKGKALSFDDPLLDGLPVEERVRFSVGACAKPG